MRLLVFKFAVTALAFAGGQRVALAQSPPKEVVRDTEPFPFWIEGGIGPVLSSDDGYVGLRLAAGIPVRGDQVVMTRYVRMEEFCILCRVSSRVTEVGVLYGFAGRTAHTSGLIAAGASLVSALVPADDLTSQRMHSRSLGIPVEGTVGAHASIVGFTITGALTMSPRQTLAGAFLGFQIGTP